MVVLTTLFVHFFVVFGLAVVLTTFFVVVFTTFLVVVTLFVVLGGLITQLVFVIYFGGRGLLQQVFVAYFVTVSLTVTFVVTVTLSALTFFVIVTSGRVTTTRPVALIQIVRVYVVVTVLSIFVV